MVTFFFFKGKSINFTTNYSQRNIFHPRAMERNMTSLESLRLGVSTKSTALSDPKFPWKKEAKLIFHQEGNNIYFYPDHLTAFNIQTHFNVHIWIKRRKGRFDTSIYFLILGKQISSISCDASSC